MEKAYQKMDAIVFRICFLLCLEEDLVVLARPSSGVPRSAYVQSCSNPTRTYLTLFYPLHTSRVQAYSHHCSYRDATPSYARG